MAVQKIPYMKVSPIESEAYQFVSTFHFFCDQAGTPTTVQLNLALDKRNAGSQECEFPVYIPADDLYLEYDHKRMLEIFRSGEPFVAVEIENLTVYMDDSGEYPKYWGTGDSFRIANMSDVLFRLSDLY